MTDGMRETGKNITGEEAMNRLRTLGIGDGRRLDIAHAALILASLDRPGVSLQKYRHHLKIIRLDLAAAQIMSGRADERARALASVLHERHAYNGNRTYYDDPQNSNLMSVIDTRKGLPVALGILYMHAARGQGWHVEGLRFPGRFLIRLQGENLSRDGQAIMDPFDGGRIVTARDLRRLIQKMSNSGAGLKPEFFEAVADRDILVRMLNNLKNLSLKVNDSGQAINILARLATIDPQHMQHHFELGMLLAHAGQRDAARESLLFCLEHLGKSGENELMKQQIRITLRELEKQGAGNCYPRS